MSPEPARFLPPLRFSAPPPVYRSPPPSAGWKPVALVAAVFLVTGALLLARHYRAAWRVSDLAVRAPTAHVTVYGPPNAVPTLRLVSSLELRGIHADFVPVTNAFDLARDGVSSRLAAQGLVAHGQVSLPVTDIDGTLVDAVEILAVLKQLPPTSMGPEKSEPYVVVYGVKNCGYTAAAVRDLEQQGIPFELRDLNASPSVGAQAESRLFASGYDADSFSTPIIDVNGYLRPRMPTSEIIRRYRAP